MVRGVSARVLAPTGLANLPRGGHFRIPEDGGDLVCHAWQRAGEVATESRQKEGRHPQRP